MDANRISILDLNEDCQLEIIKYIIADCEFRDKSPGNIMKYADLVNFALAHENFEIILEDYYEDLYRNLEFVFVANRLELKIDFSELQSTHTGKKGDAFWRVFANAIRQNNVVHEVYLEYAPESFQPNFLDHFEIIKRALENKKSLFYVTISLNGYSLEDLNNFGYITYLELDVRMTAEALVEVCKSNPHLNTLYFRSTEIIGRLSDIAPHCRNLRYLDFALKPDIDINEYAPLAELPNLKHMNIYRAFENGLLLTFFKAITKWKRTGLQPLEITFSEFLSHLRSVNIVRTNSILSLKLMKDPKGINLSASYDFWDISRDSSPLEHSLATIPLIELKIDCEGLTLYECPTSDTSGLISILKLFNIKTLTLQVKNNKTPIAKLIASIISDESYALKSIDTGSTKIDQFVTSELVKIKSITSLTCTFSDWESVKLLSALSKLETVAVKVEKKFEMTSSKALCSLINTCSGGGVIRIFDWCIEFRKIERIKSQSKRITALKILNEGRAISHILEAFSHRDLITIEELDVSKWVSINIKAILKMAEVHPIKKLRISLANTNDIEHLSDLAELEGLTIYKSVKGGSLIKLFDQMAMKATPSLQYLRIDTIGLSSEEIFLVSKIRSLKRLDLCDSEPEVCASLMRLANSNIEELTLAKQKFCLQQLFSAFAVKTTTRLQHLKIKGIQNIYLMLRELNEVSKIKNLKSLQCTCLHKDVSFLRNFKHLVKLDIALFAKNLEELRCLAELEKFESLTLRLYKYSSLQKNYDILADIQNLKELNLSVGPGVNLTNVYQAFVSKKVKLTHLTTTIGCVEELNKIMQIKTLRKLNLFIRSIGKKLACLSELSELESLQITVIDLDYIYIMGCVLPILKCCRNLDRLLINWKDSLRGIYTHLKSIRDPTLQDPLTVILTEVQDDKAYYKEYTIPELLVVLCENVYFKVFTSSQNYLF